jgi:hypothetical protein
MQPNFKETDYLTYIPNNYHLWVRKLMSNAVQEYGTLATNLLDPWKMNFDYLVSDLPISLFPLSSQSILQINESLAQRTPAKDKDESDGEDNEAKNPKESSSRLAPRRVVAKVTAKMVKEYSGSNELVKEYRTMLMKVKRDLRLKRPAFFAFILSTMTASSLSLVQLHPDYGDAEANHDVFKLVAIAKETHYVVGNKLLDPKDFRFRVAKVMYLATKTRPDLLFTVSTLASCASEPYEADVKSLNHLYDYINSNQTVPLKFQC